MFPFTGPSVLTIETNDAASVFRMYARAGGRWILDSDMRLASPRHASAELPEWAFRISNGCDIMTVVPAIDSNGTIDAANAVLIQGTASEARAIVPISGEDARDIGISLRYIFEDEVDFAVREIVAGVAVRLPFVRETMTCRRTILRALAPHTTSWHRSVRGASARNGTRGA